MNTIYFILFDLPSFTFISTFTTRSITSQPRLIDGIALSDTIYLK
ncbi:MAG: hypothetical protein ACI9P5_004206, partial [Saprospiraceae bacterium]